MMKWKVSWKGAGCRLVTLLQHSALSLQPFCRVLFIDERGSLFAHPPELLVTQIEPLVNAQRLHFGQCAAQRLIDQRARALVIVVRAAAGLWDDAVHQTKRQH